MEASATWEKSVLTRATVELQPAAADSLSVDAGIDTSVRMPTMRLEAAIGYGQGAYNGQVDFSVSHRPVEIKSDAATGGVGRTLSVGLWADDWLAENLAIGVEYWRIEQRAKASARLPEGVDVLTDPIEGKAKLALSADLLMLNVAAILGDRKRWHYLIGAGAGVARGDVRFEGSIESPFVGSSISEKEVKFLIPVGQVFAGALFDVVEPVYVTGQTHFIGGSGKPFGDTHEFYDLIVTLGAGVRF